MPMHTMAGGGDEEASADEEAILTRVEWFKATLVQM